MKKKISHWNLFIYLEGLEASQCESLVIKDKLILRE